VPPVRVPFRLVDVFAPRPFTGNQLCVVLDPPADLDTATMQALAREIGFSETTFVTEAAGDRYAMRIFTPGAELPFAGHPTIGTAYVLAREGRISPLATQVVSSGEFAVEVDVDGGFAWMTQLPAVFEPPFEDRELLARAAGLEPTDLHTDLPARVVTTGLPHLVVPIRNLEGLRRAHRQEPLVGEVCRATGGDSMYLFVVGADEVVTRMFDWQYGIGEDPATGSAAGPLGAYLAEHAVAGKPGRVLVRQGEQVGRPSELHVEVAREGGSWRPRVGGGVRAVGEGVFEL
jgi:trans-2,3-dihydro-3-hydroxyanthranilate isomerase